MQLLNEKQSLVASYLVIGVMLLLIMPLHLLSALLAGLLVYSLVTRLSLYMERFFNRRYSRIIVVALFSVLIIAGLVGLVLSLSAYVVHDLKAGGLMIINQSVTTLLEKFKQEFGHYFLGILPESIDDMKAAILLWSKAHIGTLQHMGTDVLHGLVTMIVGMILGALISLSPPQHDHDMPAFRRACLSRIQNFYQAFSNIVFAQIKISIINTIFSAIFILGVLPLLGMHLPFSKTLVILTFVLGLLPIVGNLFSNALVVISAISVSFSAAGIALLYLIFIHKFEYFLNAEIVGQRINAKAWEILMVMLVFEAVFGLSGLIAAPIYYAYLKTELKQAQLI